MRTGKMRRRIVIRELVRTDTVGGGYREDLVDIEEVWARVIPLEGREQLEAMQTGIERPHRFEIRYRPGMTSVKEIGYDGRRFDIKSVVDPEERHRELHILADEITNARENAANS